MWWNLSDPAAKKELHERLLYRRFVGLDGAVRLPDETTILRFRHVLEKHELAPQVLAIINAGLTQQDLMLKTGTVVDASIIAAPSSTKNKDGQRDPENTARRTMMFALSNLWMVRRQTLTAQG